MTDHDKQQPNVMLMPSWSLPLLKQLASGQAVSFTALVKHWLLVE
jgi:hypothetical protein